MGDCGHIGRPGDYAERAAESALVVIATVNNNGSAKRVAPPRRGEARNWRQSVLRGGADRCRAGGPGLRRQRRGRGEGPGILHQRQGSAPEGWLLDSEGEPTSDPATLCEPPSGTILPMGDAPAYKRFGLGLVFDMAADGLTGGWPSFLESPPPGATTSSSSRSTPPPSPARTPCSVVL